MSRRGMVAGTLIAFHAPYIGFGHGQHSHGEASNWHKTVLPSPLFLIILLLYRKEIIQCRAYHAQAGVITEARPGLPMDLIQSMRMIG